jgi:hypothetical protein
LLAALPDEMAESTTADNEMIRFGAGVDVERLESVNVAGAVPDIAPQAVEGLKFASALPRHLAEATLGERFVDLVGASSIADASVIESRAPQ